jgi:ribosomal protein S11
MTTYLPPLKVSKIFNIDDYTYQDGFIVYKEADERFLRPIQDLQQKTTGITYSNSTTQISKSVNINGLMNSVDGSMRNDVSVGESLAIGSNLVVGKNIVNSGNFYTNNIYAKSIVIKDAIIQNTNLTNVNIDGVPVKNLGFINTLSSDVQIQIDTNSNQLNTRITDSDANQRIYIDTQNTILNALIRNTDSSTQREYIDEQNTILNTLITSTDSTQKLYIDASYGELNTRITETNSAQKLYIDASYSELNTRITDTDSAQKLYIDASYGELNTRITDTDSAQKLYIDASYGELNTRITDTDSAQRTYIDTIIQPTLGAYFINIGVGSFPIYGSISNFADLGMDLFIKSEVDSFCIMPEYAIFAFSEINEKGSYLSMGNTSKTDIEYYNLNGINGLIRVKSIVLYKLDDTQSYKRVNTKINKNPDKLWNLQSL